jgi:RNA polymerase sigma factor (sigma-70 family)
MSYKVGGILLSDEELAAQMQLGSEEALEQLVSRYHIAIYSYIARMSGDHHASSDIVQEIFIKLCKGIRKYQQGSPFKPWLYRIASNTYKDYCKMAYVRKVVPGLDQIDTNLIHAVTPEETFLKNYEREQFIQTIDSLSDIYREIVLLRYYQELKLEEIAAVLNIPTGTVKSRLSNGLAQLKQRLAVKEF